MEKESSIEEDGMARDRDMKVKEVPLTVLATQHEKSQEATELNQCNRNKIIRDRD